MSLSRSGVSSRLSDVAEDGTSLPRPLPQEFYLQPTLIVARKLLGKTLVRRFPDGGIATARIVETEAYTSDDPASHSFRGQTERNKTMFGPPGHAYMHINYGLHHCLNAVCAPPGCAEATLIRAIEPLTGAAYLFRNYYGEVAAEEALSPQDLEALAQSDRRLGAGPGRLSKALAIDRSFDETDLTDPKSPIYLAEGIEIADSNVVTTTRIGITKGAELPWRFYVRSSDFVSKRQ